MKETDWRNTLEVAVKGLIVVVAALAGLYVLGWVFQFLGAVLLGVASIIVALLRWLVPVAIIAGVVYFIVTRVSPKPPVYSTNSGPSTAPVVKTEVVTAEVSSTPVATVKVTEVGIPSEPVSDPLDPNASVDDQTHSSDTKKSKKKDSSQT
jgi:hypothetical protein